MPSLTYTTRAEIDALLPADLVVRACDADGDGIEDTGLFDAVVSVAGDEVEALVAPALDASTLAAAPAVLRDAARKIVCDLLYRRLATPRAENPWAEAADRARELLGRIGAGEIVVAAALGAAAAAVTAEDGDWNLESQADL